MMTATTDRATFLEERRQGVGGSDVASVFSIGYGCALRLWFDKRGTPADYPDEDSGPMKLGRWLEPHIADEYAAKTGRRVIERGQAQHPDHPEMLVHIDREIHSPEKPGPGVLEIKAFGRGMFAKVKREGLPEDYILQVQHALAIKGWLWGAYACMNRDSGELAHWDVERDEGVVAAIETEVPIFWAAVENGPAPDRLDPDDRRCQSCCYRRSCQGAALMDASPDDGDVPADESMRPLLSEYDERKALFDEAEGLIEETKEVIRAAMGDRQAVRVAGRPIYHRKQVSMRMDTKLFDGCYPELVKYVRELVDSARERGVADQVIERVVNRLKSNGDFKRASSSQPLRIY